MKHFYITDKNNNPIADNLSNDCVDCFDRCSSTGTLIENCSLYRGNRRLGMISNNKSITFLCCDTTKTTKLFREKLESLSYAYHDLVIAKDEIESNIRKNEQQKVNRLVHNLSSIVAHNIQEIYDLLPADIHSSNWRNQFDALEKEVKRSPKNASKVILRIARNNIHMKSEFSIYRKIEREEHAALEFRSFSIFSVLLNVLHTFFDDFTNNGVYVNVMEYYGKVNIDYETVQVAFYHLIENSSKYVKHNSTMPIEFEDLNGNVTVKFTMISLYVNPTERDIVFNEGVSGIEAKEIGKNGDGIGMWRIKQMMTLNNGSFLAIFGDDIQVVDKIKYATNIFSLTFKKN